MNASLFGGTVAVGTAGGYFGSKAVLGDDPTTFGSATAAVGGVALSGATLLRRSQASGPAFVFGGAAIAGIGAGTAAVGISDLT